MRSKIAPVTLAVIGAVLLSTPAVAAVTGFTAVLTAFTGGGSGIPASPAPLPNSGPGALTTYTAGSSFSLGSAVFTQNNFVANTAPIPTAPNTIYVIGTVTNQSSVAGTITSTGGPAGGWGGTLGTGSTLKVILGVSSFPGASFGSFFLPINAGSTATVTAMAHIVGNVVTVTVSGKGWTTGSITYNDTNLGTVISATTHGGVGNPFATFGTTTGTNNLSSTPNGGGMITLVAPITIKIPKTLADLRAGYQTLKIVFIPEPGTLVLLGAGVAGLVALGRRRNA